ncbi:hypothetical protein [Streptomyces atratus]
MDLAAYADEAALEVDVRRLPSVCGFKSPIDYENEYGASLTMGLAS